MTDLLDPEFDLKRGATGIFDGNRNLDFKGISRENEESVSPKNLQKNLSRAVLQDIPRHRIRKRALSALIRVGRTSKAPNQPPYPLDHARRLDEHGHTDAALDLIYDRFDDLMKKKQFEQIGAVIERIVPDNYSADILLGVLTATAPVSSRVPQRLKLLAETEESLRRRGEYSDGLLIGLDV